MYCMTLFYILPFRFTGEICFTILALLTHLLPPTGAGRSAILHLVDFARLHLFSEVQIAFTQGKHLTRLHWSLHYNVSFSFLSPNLEWVLHCFAKILQHYPQLSHPSWYALVIWREPQHSTRKYVIVAKSTIPLDDGLTCAMDKPFQTVLGVCNLSYPAPLSSVFTFFEYVYNLLFST